MERNLLLVSLLAFSMATVAEAIVEFLALKGVQHIFGTVSPYSAPILRQISRNETIKLVLCYREDAAILMADGYARAHGAFAVALISGNRNSVPALPGFVHAVCDGSPIVVISAENLAEASCPPYFSQPYFANNAFDMRHGAPLSVASPHSTIQCLSKALRMTTGANKNPVYVSLPHEFLSQETVELPVEYLDDTPAEPAALARGLTERASEMLARAQNPLILLGGGAVWSGAISVAMELAEFLFAPIASSNGKSGIVPEDYPLSIGRLGTQTNVVARQAVAESDVIIVLGCRLEGATLRDVSQSIQPDTKIIQVDIDPHQLGRNLSVQLAIAGDAKRVLQKILVGLKDRGAEKWPTRVIHRMEKIWEQKAARKSHLTRLTRSTDAPIRRLRLLKDVFDEVGQDGVFLGQLEWKHGIQKTHFPLVESFDCPLPGANLPLALGAQLALPDRQVVVFLADNEAINVLGEISTAVQYRIPVLIVIARENYLITPPNGDSVAGDRSVPNFAAAALAMGAFSQKIEKHADIRRTVRQALASRRPSLLEVKVQTSVDHMAPRIS
ncbi:MAG TPA: thiamine pyrophosphate-binding protein [Candidatus Binatia bacterium]|nr:thiamine pyrophosphate-binding protein [Candidatus Binatia bacterium]